MEIGCLWRGKPLVNTAFFNTSTSPSGDITSLPSLQLKGGTNVLLSETFPTFNFFKKKCHKKLYEM